MKVAVIVSPGKVEVWDVPEPEIGDYQVLVRMLACGICNGTDWKLIDGHFKGFHTYPAVLGHEGVGEVVECGAKVRNLRPGDMVLRPGLERIGDGSIHSGWGGFSEYAIAGDWKAMMDDGMGPGTEGFLDLYYSQQTVPEDIGAVDAVMLITFKEVLSGAKRFGFQPGRSLLVFGAGPVGLCFVMFAKMMGMGPVIACDLEERRLDLARAVGADASYNPQACDLASEVKKLVPEGLDFAVDAAGATHLVNTALPLIKFNGKVCVYGIAPSTSVHLDWERAPYNWDVHFVQWPTFTEESATHAQVVEWVRMRQIDPRRFISHVMPFSRIHEGLSLVKSKEALKVVISF